MHFLLCPIGPNLASEFLRTPIVADSRQSHHSNGFSRSIVGGAV
jgi:hypothetical protein